MAYLAGVGTTWELPLGLGFLNLWYLVTASFTFG